MNAIRQLSQTKQLKVDMDPNTVIDGNTNNNFIILDTQVI